MLSHPCISSSVISEASGNTAVQHGLRQQYDDLLIVASHRMF